MRNLKRMAAWILASVLTLSMSAVALAAEGDTGFADVAADSWYGDAVYWARLNGVSVGTGANTFSPDGSLTREQAVTMMYHYAVARGEDAVESETALQEYEDFADISDWAGEAMSWAVENGLLAGDGAGHLNPQKSATRAELAVMLVSFTAILAN